MCAIVEQSHTRLRGPELAAAPARESDPWAGLGAALGLTAQLVNVKHRQPASPAQSSFCALSASPVISTELISFVWYQTKTPFQQLLEQVYYQSNTARV